MQFVNGISDVFCWKVFELIPFLIDEIQRKIKNAFSGKRDLDFVAIGRKSILQLVRLFQSACFLRFVLSRTKSWKLRAVSYCEPGGIT